MATMNDCLNILRRRVGDTEEPYTFDDTLLIGYIEDSVVQVEFDFKRGISVSEGEFIGEVSDSDALLFAIKADYLIKLRTKSKADRDNFLMRKGRLTLDNTNQSGDHKETLKIVDREYKRFLMQARNNGQQKGVRVE